MSLESFHTNKYKLLIQDHLYRTILFLLEEGIEFSVAAELRYCSFSPELPSQISAAFGEVTLFALAGYSFETIELDEADLYFEAGFGAEGFGSHVHIPLLAIKQLFVEEYPIAINISEPIREKALQTETRSSMEALLNNPENQKLLKKQKKR